MIEKSIMICSILSGTPIYYLYLFRALYVVYKNIEKLMAISFGKGWKKEVALD